MGRREMLIAGLLLGSLTGSAWGQRKLPFSPKATAKANAAQNAIDREQDRRQRLNQAKRNFTKAELEAIAAASQQIVAAKVAHQAAIKEFQGIRDKATVSVEASLGLKKLQEEVAVEQNAYREASDPVLHALKGSPEYKAAEKSAASARSQIEELRENASLSADEKRARLQTLMRESLAVSNLEREALQKEPAIQAARERMEAAQRKLGEQRKRAEEKIERDASVTAAQQAVKEAYAAVQAAEANLAMVEAQGAAGEQLLQAGVIPRGAKPEKKENSPGKAGGRK